MSIEEGDNVVIDDSHPLGQVEQILGDSIAIICYEGPKGNKKQIRKPISTLGKPLDRQDENPCPDV